MGESEICHDYNQAWWLFTCGYDQRNSTVFRCDTSLRHKRRHYSVKICLERKGALYLSLLVSYVDEKLKESKRFLYKKIIGKYPVMKDKLKFWTPELCALAPKTFDFIITVSWIVI
jgi:hypothetical protein